MPFAKGKSGNINGRPSDPNVKALREAVRGKLLNEDRIKKLFDALDNLSGHIFIEYYLKIHREVMPPLAAEITQEVAENSVVSILELVYDKMNENKAG